MSQREFWLSGPVEDIIPLLQPVAHALLQSEREVKNIMKEFPEAALWQKPAGMASVGFHLQHLAGVLDRLFTYAMGKSLSESQLTYLSSEDQPNELSSGAMVEHFAQQVKDALNFLKQLKEEDLLQFREVGRAKLPSNVLGLLFHAAEHTMRHTGQLLVSVAFVERS